MGGADAMTTLYPCNWASGETCIRSSWPFAGTFRSIASDSWGIEASEKRIWTIGRVSRLGEPGTEFKRTSHPLRTGSTLTFVGSQSFVGRGRRNSIYWDCAPPVKTRAVGAIHSLERMPGRRPPVLVLCMICKINIAGSGLSPSKAWCATDGASVDFGGSLHAP